MNFLLFLKSDIARTSQVLRVSWVRIVLSERFWAYLLIRLVLLRSVYLLPLSGIASVVLRILFGIVLARQAKIGRGLVLPHPQNIILGCYEIGDNCTVMHNVTLGAKFVDPGFSSSSRPIISQNCFIGVGSVILGPGTVEEYTVVKPNEVIVLGGIVNG